MKISHVVCCSILAGTLLTACSAPDHCAQNTKIQKTQTAVETPSPLAIHCAQKLPQAIIQNAIERIKNEHKAQQQTWQKQRSEAEAAYQAAKERGEKTKSVPRADLKLSKHITSHLPKIRHSELIAEIYAIETAPRREYFVHNEQLSPAAWALLETLEQLDLHALDSKSFESEKLKTAAERLAQMKTAITANNPLQLNAYEILAMSKTMDKGWQINGKTLNTAALQTLSEAEQIQNIVTLLCDDKISPVPRLAAQCQLEYEYRLEMSQFADALEFALADAWLSYAQTLKYGNLEKFSKAEYEKFTRKDNPNHIHPKHHDRIIEERLANATVELYALNTQEAVTQYLKKLAPEHEQYPKLQKLREKYRQIVANGGWKTVPADRMFAGGQAPLVKNLKERLAAEGYYQGHIDESFDEPLTAAIKAYQKHHQLEETGAVSDVFWRSLNVPAEQRLAEIEINIRRWHKTMYEPRETYIYINIPSFTVELWHQGKRIAEHRTVVGNASRICNTRTQEWEMMNATRLMHARMTYLVFNPYWNVPPRIEVDEYQPKMAEDPKWLENSDFEYYTPKGGGRVLRQKPGQNNALGKVKLIFPNSHNTYLHDTPKQGMFSYPIRAFSHGCIRVENAMNFAQAVLTVDGQWDENRIERFFVEKGEHPVDLKTPIDVFIEYHTVTADDEGNAYFLADVYRIIKDEMQPPTDLQRRCDPTVDKTSTFRSGAQEDSGP